jgi:hypothetical protein
MTKLISIVLFARRTRLWIRVFRFAEIPVEAVGVRLAGI